MPRSEIFKKYVLFCFISVLFQLCCAVDLLRLSRICYPYNKRAAKVCTRVLDSWWLRHVFTTANMITTKFERISFNSDTLLCEIKRMFLSIQACFQCMAMSYQYQQETRKPFRLQTDVQRCARLLNMVNTNKKPISTMFRNF